ncbi:MAG: hypothetical protein K5829_09205 [Treponema sp.]|nr:hypothetical protein [Treponema sp.]
MKRNLFSIIFFIFILSIGFSQNSVLEDYVVRSWTTADGLPGNTINRIIQSDDGYIYAGTYEGLVRFDGYDFTILKKTKDSGYCFSSARALFMDSKGRIWIGANDEGVNCISDDSIVCYDVHNGMPNNSIRAITEDKNGNIWIGTAAGVVYISQDGNINYPDSIEGLNSSQVLVERLFCDSAGRVWLISTDLNGIYYYAGDSFKHYTNLNSFGDFFFTAISQDQTGAFWLGAGNQGLYKIVNGRVEKLHTGTILDTVPTYVIYSDETGSIWFGTDKGLVLYRNGKYYIYTENKSLPENSINDIISDREGNIWVGTSNKGLLKLSPGKFRVIHMSSASNAIAEDFDGLLWVACDDGLYCFDSEQMISNELTEYCKNLRIRHVAIASNGDILVCAYSKPAMIRYSKSEGIQSWCTDTGLAGDKTRVAIESSSGDLYVGTTTGLSIIKKDGSVKSFQRQDGFETDYIMCLYEDEEGLIWIGTDGGGIYIMNHEALIDKITTINGLAGNVIFKIMQDNQGIFWVCSGTGISRIEKREGELPSRNSKEKIFNYTSENGLLTNSIFQMIFDYTGIVWMISNAGVFAVPYKDLTALYEDKINHLDPKFFNQNDGLKTDGFTSTALSSSDKNGRIWFTLVDGIALYDPLKASSKEVLPLAHVESVKLDNEIKTSFIEPITIPTRTKRVEIKYTGLSFNSPERTRFSYMLEGFDERFSELTASRVATYTALHPGTYTFLLRAYNSDGVYAEASEKIVLIQAPLLYQRKLFWFILIAALLILILIIFYVRDRASKIYTLQLETKVQERTVELEMAKDETDKLLKNILPESIAERLKQYGYSPVNDSLPPVQNNKNDSLPEKKVEISDEFEEVSFDDIISDSPVEKRVQIADKFDNVTVLFSDIVGFTKTTSKASAEDIVSSLNDLFYRFDTRAEKMGIEKIKTIGDAYMAACGVPNPDSNHYIKMVEFAHGMYEDLADYNKTSKIKFNLRIGINSGPVIAGVIGKNKFIYDLWGDTVNVASRMETLCSPGGIRITENVRNLLYNHTNIKSCLEEDCEVKGKGKMKTFEIEL